MRGHVVSDHSQGGVKVPTGGNDHSQGGVKVPTGGNRNEQ